VFLFFIINAPAKGKLLIFALFSAFQQKSSAFSLFAWKIRTKASREYAVFASGKTPKERKYFYTILTSTL
jgi:hypothetical protein